jgi:hypothetical protein
MTNSVSVYDLKQLITTAVTNVDGVFGTNGIVVLKSGL